MHSSSGGWMTILVQNKHLLNLSLEQEVTVIILPTDVSQYTLCQACILHRSQTQYCWWLMACFQHLHLTTLHFFFWGKKFSLTVALLAIILWLNLWIFVFFVFIRSVLFLASSNNLYHHYTKHLCGIGINLPRVHVSSTRYWNRDWCYRSEGTTWEK